MKRHYLFCFCVASYSGGDFFTPMDTHSSNTAAGAFVSSMLPAFSDDLATLSFSSENTFSHFNLRPDHLPFPPQPLLQAHAHNDYEHERPLFDALEQGFTYIEADVYLIDNELFVSHMTPLFLSKEKTLRQCYLEPLREVIGCNGGRVFPQGDLPLHLMIDIKTGAAATYERLKTYLEPYRQMLTSFENGVKTERAVTIFLSGNRPVEQILAEKSTFMCLDGRIEDLGKGIPSDLMPVVSERFSNIFGWEIFGQEHTENQWLTLQRLARLTHAEGKKLRLWASPEREEVWQKLLDAGCDLLNTDELERLRRFLQAHQPVRLAWE
jgi:hypothetical protein